MTPNPSITITAAPDESDRARDTIEIWLALDPEAQNEKLARLIAATIHAGENSALEAFATQGTLDAEAALDELNYVRVPLQREGWVDALGRYILARGGRS